MRKPLTNKQFSIMRNLLNDFENSIIDEFALRILNGRKEYGAWDPSDDGRDYIYEVNQELFDALSYYIAESKRSRR